MNVLFTYDSKLKLAGIVLLMVSLFGGKFSLDRLLEFSAKTHWLELRFWCLVASAIISLFYLRRESFSISRYTKKLIGFLIAFLLFAMYLSINLITLGAKTNFWTSLIDLLMPVAGAILILIYFRSEADLIIFAGFAEVVGFLLFTLSLLNFGNHELNGPGWSPVGGPITFYRMEFLTFCSALYLCARAEARYSKFLHAIIAAIGLYSSLASLSKAALVGTGIIVVYFLFWELTTGNKKRAAVVVLISGIVILGFFIHNGSIMHARIVTSGVQEQRQTGRDFRTMLLEMYSPTVTFQELNKTQKDLILSIADTYKVYGPPDYKSNLPSFIRYSSQILFYRDHSERILLSFHAWKLFKQHIWFGAGIGNYRYSVINLCTTHIEHYHYPHNLILELLATTGLTGLILFGVSVLSVTVLLQQLFYRNNNILFFMGYGFFILLTALVTGDYYDFRTFWFASLITLSSFQNTVRYQEQAPA